MPVQLEIENPDSLTSIREAVEQHYRDNPKHGAGCACVDEAIRVLRRGLNPLAYNYEAKNNLDEAGRKALSAMYGVVQSAMRG